MSLRRRIRIASEALLAVSLVVSAARADDAAELKRRGDVAFDAHRFDEAASAYERAFVETKDPAILYNLGRSYEALGRYAEALDRLSFFVATATPELRARVPKLTQLVEDLKNRVASLTITCNAPAARLIVRNVVVGEINGTKKIDVNSGLAKIEVLKDGYEPFVTERDLRAREVTTITVDLVRQKQALGTFHVRSIPPMATIKIDGQQIGTAPVQLDLPPGTHRVLATREGYVDYETTEKLEPGQRREIDVALSERTSPITSKWWFWTTIGVVLAAGGAATFFALTTEETAPSGSIPPGQVTVQAF